jgi:16S rRNA (adenine1518-N6/adenine1519-N6)-dimethyltransferase
MIRRRGQNFLIDHAVIERMADYANLSKRDIVLEIGAGTGNLTEILADRAGFVYAVEVDPRLATGLIGRFSNVDIIKGDALKINYPFYSKVVSNLPYQISSKIIKRLLIQPFDMAVLMCQAEFAQRMMALPGNENYGRLSMIVGRYCFPEILELVSRSSFRPVPKVDSSILRLKPRIERPEANDLQFFKFVEKLFTHRRKKIRTILSSSTGSRKMLKEFDSDILEKRAEELWPDEVACLVNIISPQLSQE